MSDSVSPKKTYFGLTTLLKSDNTLHDLSNTQREEAVNVIAERLAGRLHKPQRNIAPTGDFIAVKHHNLLLRGQALSWHAEKTSVLDCVKHYHKKVDVIGFGKLQPGTLYVMQDHPTSCMDEMEAAFDEHLNAIESELNAEEVHDKVFRVIRGVIRKARTDPQYKRNFMKNAEGSQMALSQLMEYVQGCVTFKDGRQQLFQDSEEYIIRGMGLPWITLSYKHEAYEGDYRISLEKLEGIWKAIAKHTGVDDFCLWVDHVMRLRKYSTRDWYAVGIEPYSLGTVLRYLRKPYDVAESMIDVNPGLWLSCEAVLGITNKGLYCLREGEGDVEVIDSGIHLGAKTAVEILAVCFMNNRLLTKKVYHQEDSQGFANWACAILIADYHGTTLDVPTLKQLIPDLLSLESKPELFNRIERHLGVMGMYHQPTEHGEWRRIRGIIPFLVLEHKEIECEFEDSRCKVFGCDQCDKKVGVLECFRDDCGIWKAVTISGLESNVTGPEGHVLLTMKLSPIESSMLQVGETLDGLSHVGAGMLVICDRMRLINDMKLKDVRWTPCESQSL